MTPTATAIAAPNPHETANVRDLNLMIVDENNFELFRGLNPRLGDIYKQVVLPSGAMAVMPLRTMDLQEVEDRIDTDKVDFEGKTITFVIK